MTPSEAMIEAYDTCKASMGDWETLPWEEVVWVALEGCQRKGIDVCDWSNEDDIHWAYCTGIMMALMDIPIEGTHPFCRYGAILSAALWHGSCNPNDVALEYCR